MSHYSTIDTQFGFKNELIETLKEIYGNESVEVHNKPTTLYTFNAEDRQGETAEIIVRRQFLSSLSNDLGFKLENGCYNMIVSDYDVCRSVKPQEIVARYAKKVIKNRLPNMRVIKMDENKIKLQVKV